MSGTVRRLHAPRAIRHAVTRAPRAIRHAVVVVAVLAGLGVLHTARCADCFAGVPGVTGAAAVPVMADAGQRASAWGTSATVMIHHAGYVMTVPAVAVARAATVHSGHPMVPAVAAAEDPTAGMVATTGAAAGTVVAAAHPVRVRPAPALPAPGALTGACAMLLLAVAATALGGYAATRQRPRRNASGPVADRVTVTHRASQASLAELCLLRT